MASRDDDDGAIKAGTPRPLGSDSSADADGGTAEDSMSVTPATGGPARKDEPAGETASAPPAGMSEDDIAAQKISDARKKELEEKNLYKRLRAQWPGDNMIKGDKFYILLDRMDKLVDDKNVEPNGKGFTITMESGRQIHWVKEEGKQELDEIRADKNGPINGIFNEKDALAIVTLAAIRGWQSIEVHGTEKQKDFLWLAAMQMGIEVPHYTPTNKDVLQNWEKKKAEMEAKGIMPPGAVDNPPDAAGGDPRVTKGGSRFMPKAATEAGTDTPAELSGGGASGPMPDPVDDTPPTPSEGWPYPPMASGPTVSTRLLRGSSPTNYSGKTIVGRAFGASARKPPDTAPGSTGQSPRGGYFSRPPAPTA